MSLYVSELPTLPLAGLLNEESYDLVLASVGFEERSSAIPAHLNPPGLGLGLTFKDRREDAYDANRAAMLERAYELWQPPEESDEMVDEVGVLVRRAASLRELTEDAPLRIAVDISSMTRIRIAAVIQAVYRLPSEDPVIVDILYAPAQYRPSGRSLASWVHAQPVSDFFAGWDPDTAKRLLTVIGLGYELNAAEGVIDYLTPDESFMFIPKGRDSAYRNDVEQANEDVLRNADDRMVYDIEHPYRLVLNLERLVLAHHHERRLLMVPLGPKIFAAACFVAAARLYPQISVWRFSDGPTGEAQPAAAAGWVCGLRLSTRPEATHGYDAVRGADDY